MGSSSRSNLLNSCSPGPGAYKTKDYIVKKKLFLFSFK